MSYAKSIVVHAWSIPRVPSVNTWRRGARKAMRDGIKQDRDDHIRPKELDDRVRLPFFYRNFALHIARETTQEELTLQLAIIFSRWGLMEFTTEDREVLVRYLCHLWRRQEKFRAAAEEALSYLLTNWVIPHEPEDFRRYARQTVWACYAKGARPLERGAKPRRARSEEEEEESAPERRAERHRRGRGSGPLHTDYISIRDLALASRKDPRRIYESIEAGKLEAVKVKMSLRVKAASAQDFITRALQKRKARDLRAQLEGTGITKDAIRKRIYRLRKSGANEADIIRALEALLKKQTLSHNLSSNGEAS